MTRFGRPESQVEVLGANQISIRTDSLTDLGLRADDLRQAVATEAGITSDQINEQDVGPTWGGTISSKAITGLIVFLVLVSLYISLRFEPKMAGAALAALFHDLLATAGIYALVGFEVTPATVIALLTLLGYSLYDTVVVFDKIRENGETLTARNATTYSAMVNRSVNQVLMRSINTSLTSLLPVGGLLFVGAFLLGASTLEDLALALFVGILVGTYSSIFVASPILAWWKEREPRYQKLRARVTGVPARVPSARFEPEPAVVGSAPREPSGDGPRAPLRVPRQPPRGPRRRRRGRRRR
jgi:preprotein translocase subunit SecF